MHLIYNKRVFRLFLIILSILASLFSFKNFIKNTFIFFTKNLMYLAQEREEQLVELKKENLILSLKNREYENLKIENEKLKKILGFREEKKLELLGVNIVLLEPSSWRRLAVIDAGKNKGIKDGSFAIDENGYLVGKIINVKENYSFLLFIDDPNFSLPVFIGENAIGLLKGGLGSIKIQYIENIEGVKVKDKVWIKIYPFSYPIYIGEVKKIVQDRNSLFLDIEVKLFSENLFINKIFIVK